MKYRKLNLPLMSNNIVKEDRDALIEFLKGDPILTQSKQVELFEEEWSKWLGVKYSVFVNSGASANLLTMLALSHMQHKKEVIVPALTWVSDIASILHAGLTPVIVDINQNTLGMNWSEVEKKINDNTAAVFPTHILGYNAFPLAQTAIEKLNHYGGWLIEDCCESHGATHLGKKVGAHGRVSNFSFYYAHHLTTIEGGMICTDDEFFYNTVRSLRSHGMVREMKDVKRKELYKTKYPDLNPDFIFAYASHNVRSTELNAVIGRNQLTRLDHNNVLRRKNLDVFLDHLNSQKFQTHFWRPGNSNYAFTLVLQKPDLKFRNRVEKCLRLCNVEFRRGLSGGGNQLRQPYLVKRIPWKPQDYRNVEHVHRYGWYIGNYPDLEHKKIVQLCEILNKL